MFYGYLGKSSRFLHVMQSMFSQEHEILAKDTYRGLSVLGSEEGSGLQVS